MERSNETYPLGLPPELIDRLAEAVAIHLAETLPARPEPYLDVAAAAEYLAAPRSRIYELVERGRVVVHRDGRRLLFRPSDLDAALQREEPRP